MYRLTIKIDGVKVEEKTCEDSEILYYLGDKLIVERFGQDIDFKDLTFEVKKISKSQSNEYSESFLKFWDLYPHTHRGNKAKLWNAYKKVIIQKRATDEQILNGLEKYKLSRRVAEGYIKGGEAWLNNDMFFADLPLAQQTTSNFMDRFKES